MAFKDIVGHEKQVSWLKRAYQMDCLTGCYLFVGREGIGKRLVALNLAKFINCQSAKEDACEQCPNCQKINQGVHPDVFVIEPQAEVLKIEQIRAIQKTLGLKPAMALKRVVIVNDAYKLTLEAANAFLKTLEEPPLNTIIILLCHDISQMLTTIVSRCQVIKFAPLSFRIVVNMLQDKGLDERQSQFIARIAAGSPGKALLLAEHWEDIINLLANSSSLIKSFPAIDNLLATLDKKGIFLFLDVYQAFLRDLLLVKKGLKEFTVGFLEYINPEFSQLSLETINRQLNFLLRAKKLIQRNVQPTLVLEQLVLQGETL